MKPKLFIQKTAIRMLKRAPEKMLLRIAGGERLTIGGRTIDPMLQVLWVMAQKEAPLTQMSPEEARQTTREAFSVLEAAPRPMESIENRTIPGPGGEIPVRIYRPEGAQEKPPLLIYFHQGGCVIGDLDTCQTFCTVLADEAKCVVMSVDYRLAPEHRFPAATEDGLAVYRWAREHGAEIGVDSERIAMGGDSAGGLITAVITHEMKRRAEPQPELQLLIYPWLCCRGDSPSHELFAESFPLGRELMEWFIGHYLTDPCEMSDPRVSPLDEKDFSGLPPAIVATAGFDPLVDEGEAYARKLREAGVRVDYKCYDNLTHSFTAFSGASAACRAAIEEIAGKVKEALAAYPGASEAELEQAREEAQV